MNTFMKSLTRMLGHGDDPSSTSIFLGGVEEKADRIEGIVTYNDYLSARFATDRLEQYTEFMTTYRQNVWAYSCIYEIANGIASSAMKAYYTDPDGYTFELLDGELVELLTRVNAFYGQHTLKEGTMTHLETTGNCYWELVTENGQVPSVDNKPVEIYFLQPDRMLIVPDFKEYIKEYIYNSSGKDIHLEKERVIHLKYFNPESEYYGMSPIAALVHSLTMEWEAQKYGTQFFRNHAQLSGIVRTDQKLGDSAFDRIRKQWQQKYSGSDNAYKTVVLDSGLDWKEVSLGPKEADFLATRNINKKEIVAAFGMFPILLGEDTQNYAQAQIQERLFWSKTLLPKLRKIEEALNEKLLPLFYAVEDGVKIKFDLSTIPSLVEGEAQKIEKISKLFQFGMLTPNEGRELMGMDPVDDPAADTLYVPLNLQAVGISERKKPMTGKASSRRVRRHGENDFGVAHKLLNGSIASEKKMRQRRMRMVEGLEAKMLKGYFPDMAKVDATIASKS